MTDIIPSTLVKQFEVPGSDKKVYIRMRMNNGWMVYSAFHGNEDLKLTHSVYAADANPNVSDARFIDDVKAYFRRVGSSLREIKP